MYDARYHDIEDASRIVTTYEVIIDGHWVSVSVMTVEFSATPDGTNLRVTEQGAFVNGLDANEQRQEGATDSLDKLGAYLESSGVLT